MELLRHNDNLHGEKNILVLRVTHKNGQRSINHSFVQETKGSSLALFRRTTFIFVDVKLVHVTNSHLETDTSF